MKILILWIFQLIKVQLKINKQILPRFPHNLHKTSTISIISIIKTQILMETKTLHLTIKHRIYKILII